MIKELISSVVYWFVQYVMKVAFVFRDLNNFKTLSSRESRRIIKFYNCHSSTTDFQQTLTHVVQFIK